MLGESLKIYPAIDNMPITGTYGNNFNDHMAGKE